MSTPRNCWSNRNNADMGNPVQKPVRTTETAIVVKTFFGVETGGPNIAVPPLRRIAVIKINAPHPEAGALRTADSRRITVRAWQKIPAPISTDRVQEHKVASRQTEDSDAFTK